MTVTSSNIYGIPIGVQVSTDNTTWYNLSDHNREPIQIQYDLVQQTQRMGNGTLRQYIVARKFKITTDWKNFPSVDSYLVDYNKSLGDVPQNAKGAAFIKSFYEINAFQPVYVNLIYAQESNSGAPGTLPQTSTYVDSRNTSGQTFQAFMTTFKYDISKRMLGNASTNFQGYDYVDLTIEFTEI